MKIEELSVGNIVGFKNRTDFFGVVFSLSGKEGVEIKRYFDSQPDYEDIQIESVNDLVRIDITSKWLEKLGLTASYGFGGVSLSDMKYTITINNAVYSIKTVGHRNDIGLFKNGHFLMLLK